MSSTEDERPQLRIGNAEREAALKALDAHLEAGRLDMDEYADRYARATVARTRPDLEALFADLPEPRPFQAQAPKRQWLPADARRYVPVSVLGRIVVTFLVLAAVVALVPVIAAGALIWFVVIPMMAGRGCHRGWAGHRAWASRRGWYGPVWR